MQKFMNYNNLWNLFNMPTIEIIFVLCRQYGFRGMITSKWHLCHTQSTGNVIQVLHILEELINVDIHQKFAVYAGHGNWTSEVSHTVQIFMNNYVKHLCTVCCLNQIDQDCYSQLYRCWGILPSLQPILAYIFCKLKRQMQQRVHVN